MTGVSRDVMDLFMSYNWPGNVRELKNALEYAFVTAEGPVIGLDHLPKPLIPEPANLKHDSFLNEIKTGAIDEKQQLIEALIKTRGNQTRAAELLKVNRVTVWNRMKKYRIDLKKTLEC